MIFKVSYLISHTPSLSLLPLPLVSINDNNLSVLFDNLEVKFFHLSSTYETNIEIKTIIKISIVLTPACMTAVQTWS